MHQVREATPADNDALIELERRSPLDLGDSTLTFDRSPNFFAHQQMEEHGRVLVAEDGQGRLAGIVAGAWHDVLIEGHPRRLLYIHQGRIPPEHRRNRVATDITVRHIVLVKDVGAEAPYWLISPDNTTSLSFGQQPGVENWPVDGRMDSFDVNARRPAGKNVGAVAWADLPQIVDLINATHDGREMFIPYTVASLERRLRLSPSYGLPQWRAYRSRDGIVAAAGVWDYNRSLRITHRAKSGGSVRTSLPAYVLDYGYAAGAEEAMLEVIMAMMDIAAAAGRSDLSMNLPVERRLYSLMEPLPHSTSTFRILTPGIPTPKAVNSSVYLDPVYV